MVTGETAAKNTAGGLLRKSPFMAVMEFFLQSERAVTFLLAELSREVHLRLTQLLHVLLQDADVPVQDDLRHKTNAPQREKHTLLRG